MSYFISFVVAVILTALSYFIGSLLAKNKIDFWKAFVIGGSVVSVGAITEALGAPIWLIVLAPFPVGMILLYVFLQKPLKTWLITYITTLLFYTIIHVIVSFFFDYHSLIPAWKL
jgi:hypothetical protein